MKAINYFVVLEKIKEAPKKVKGLELTEKQNKDVRYIKGRVVSVGDQVDMIKENDTVRALRSTRTSPRRQASKSI